MKVFKPYNNLMMCIKKAQENSICTTFNAGDYIEVEWEDEEKGESFFVAIQSEHSCYVRRKEDHCKIDNFTTFEFQGVNSFAKQLVKFAENKAKEYMYIIEYSAHLLSELTNI